MSVRVLIVEDEPLAARDLELIVEHAGHQVAGVALDMGGALALAAIGKLDMAIVDIALARRSDGIETARRLFDEFGVRSLFVTVQTGRRAEAMTPEWQPLGFVAKPYVAREIVEALPRGGAPVIR